MIYTNEQKAMFAYLSTEGLSEKEAAALNKGAAQYYEELTNRCAGLTFLNKTTVDENGKEHQTKGANATMVADLEGIANTLVDVNKLNEWLNNALSAKEELQLAIQDICMDDFCDEKGMETPVLKDSEEYIESLELTVPPMPQKTDAITDAEAIGLLSVSDRNRYYALNAECAVLGKFLHKNGAFSRARAELQHALGTPVELDSSNYNLLVVYTNTPSVGSQVVEDTFFALQAKYRSAQAELNGIKKQIDQTKLDDARQKAEQFAKKTEQYREAVKTYNDSRMGYAAYVEAYNMQVAELRIQIKSLQKSELERIAHLKYVVPTELAAIVREVKQRYHLG